MTPDHQQVVDSFWATEMAMPPEFRPRPQNVHVTVQHIYPGVQLFQRDDWLVIASPPQLADLITDRTRDLSVHEIFSIDSVARLLSLDAENVIGPAHVGYADASMFRPSPIDSCRILTEDEAGIIPGFAATLSPADLEQTGFDARDTPTFGAFANGILHAVANYHIWKPRLAHITVATHPLHRRHGHGRAVVSALAAHALAQGLVLQYRAIASNANSLALGHSLGFQKYCSTIYARLPAA
jgi:GNAT superfamily N-acetyltransferase